MLLLAGFFLLMMLMGVASATTVDINSPIQNSIMNRQDTYNVNVTVDGWSEGSVTRYLVLDIWDNNAYDTIAYYRNKINVTGNINHTFVVNDTDLPFNGQEYYLRLRLCYADENYTQIAGTLTNEVSIGAPWRTNTYRLAISGVDPPSYDLGASRVINRGVKFNLVSANDEAITVHIFLLQTDENGVFKLQGYGSRSAIYKNEYTVEENGTGVLVGFDWAEQTTNPKSYDMREGYYMFIGVRYGTGVGQYKFSNTLFTCSDGSVVGGSTVVTGDINADGLSIWGLNNFLQNTTVNLGYNTGDTYKYMGYFTYFETFPSWAVPAKYTVGNDPVGTFGSIQDWANNLGLPFLPLLFGALIPIGMMAFVYRFALKYSISIPNYIYAFIMLSGVALAFYIGFIELWMFALFITTLILSIIIKWREQIEKAVGMVSSKKWDKDNDHEEDYRPKKKSRLRLLISKKGDEL